LARHKKIIEQFLYNLRFY